ncbi:hypothetical protein AAF712_014761 [Marasmius tenuissimus]|uniref:Uncharacterized protein n=1 Tax=Marasmius tenuissimus TaxID=585030 RepID=A0ABR2ZC48_9AGAR|nr:hypothetical protein PM082_013238 [Marasmius tenuissimus]
MESLLRTVTLATLVSLAFAVPAPQAFTVTSSVGASPVTVTAPGGGTFSGPTTVTLTASSTAVPSVCIGNGPVGGTASGVISSSAFPTVALPSSGPVGGTGSGTISSVAASGTAAVPVTTAVSLAARDGTTTVVVGGTTVAGNPTVSTGIVEGATITVVVTPATVVGGTTTAFPTSIPYCSSFAGSGTAVGGGATGVSVPRSSAIAIVQALVKGLATAQ